MAQNIPMAIVVAMLSSLAFAGAATVQGSAVSRQVGANVLKQRMTLADLLVVLRAPRWLAGLALAGLGALLNTVGLLLAPLTVVQPVGVLAVPWAVVLAVVFRRRKITRIAWFAVAAALAGTVGFLSLSASHAASGAAVDPTRVTIACAVVYLAAEALRRLGERGRRRWRSFFWATGGAFFYGLESALVRTMRDLASRSDWLQTPIFWALAIALVVGSIRGAWMIQQAYATGVSETVVAALTVTNPVVAVLFGIVVLGEGADLAGATVVGMLMAAALAIFGVVVLSQADVKTKPVDAGL